MRPQDHGRENQLIDQITGYGGVQHRVFGATHVPSLPGFDLAIEKTGGRTDVDAMITAMKGLKWESPRGPIEIDRRTRDIVQNEYIRRVERVNGKLSNVELQTYPMVKDPAKEANR